MQKHVLVNSGRTEELPPASIHSNINIQNVRHLKNISGQYAQAHVMRLAHSMTHCVKPDSTMWPTPDAAKATVQGGSTHGYTISLGKGWCYRVRRMETNPRTREVSR